MPGMRAAHYRTYGDLDVLEVGDLPDPKIAPGEALVEVRSASVNPVDWKVMAGGLDPLMNVRFPAVRASVVMPATVEDARSAAFAEPGVYPACSWMRARPGGGAKGDLRRADLTGVAAARGGCVGEARASP